METKRRGKKTYHIKVHLCFRACAPIPTRCVRGTNLDANCGVARTRSPLIAAQLHSVLGFSPLRNSPLLICIARSFHDTATHIRTRSGCSSEASVSVSRVLRLRTVSHQHISSALVLSPGLHSFQLGLLTVLAPSLISGQVNCLFGLFFANTVKAFLLYW